MVPIADLFNHTDMHNVHVEAEENVCMYCGVQHRGSCHAVISSSISNTVDVRCVEEIDTDEELINTYGELGNAELLCQYGFVLGSKTLNDRCSWSPDLPSDRRELERTLAHFLAYTPAQDTHTPGLTLLLASMDSTHTPTHVDATGKHSATEAFAESALVSLQSPRDQQRPLFLDATGRISWCLWRFFVGAVLVCRSTPIKGWSLLVNQVFANARAIDVEQRQPTAATALARQCLAHLCTMRLQNNYAATHDDEAGAILEHDATGVQAESTVLCSVVLHALQESDILHRALHNT